MAHYFVTGCAGFIGSKVCRLLIDGGHTVSGVDNLNDAYDVKLKDWRLKQLLQSAGFRFFKADITHADSLHAAWNVGPKPHGVIHLAAYAGVRASVASPRTFFEVNVLGTLNLLDLVRDEGVTRFLLASTSSVYGDSDSIPFVEESASDRPLSPYAASKKSAESLCYSYHHLYGIRTMIPRFFTVYGPAGRPDMSAFRFVQRISEGLPITVFGDGSQQRDFTYIDDIAAGAVTAITSDCEFEIFNLGGGSPVPLIDVIRTIEELTGRKAIINYEADHRADVPATWANTTKVKRLLGWEAKVPISEGLSHLVRWYQENVSWARFVRG